MTEVNETYGCILSKFYIKPQPLTLCQCCKFVVSYRNSTSNHNLTDDMPTPYRLYLIEILHQTTTSLTTCPRRIGCILSKFYIKPQLAGRLPRGSLRCILSKFYIKPQRSTLYGWKSMVVSYRNSTSNHNSLEAYIRQMKLYLIEILHQTTTTRPVLEKRSVLYLIEILHQTTTSLNGWRLTLELYLIEILHQTTTLAYIFYTVSCCILSKFYIKPQL